MMNVLLIAWTFIAACASFVIGAWMTFSAHGERVPGVVLMLTAALVVGLGVQLCRERISRVRPRVAVQYEYVEPAPVRQRRPAAAVSQNRKPSRKTAPPGAASNKAQGRPQGVRGKQVAVVA
jgi:hypothetical protein